MNSPNHFMLLERADQVSAIARLSRSGMDDQTIASVTGFTVEEICRITFEAQFRGSIKTRPDA
jgi:hypothetical protein